MSKKKNSVFNKENILLGIVILLMGVVIGICLNTGDTFALETSTSLGASTSSNATDSNATSSNATDSNATSSNATSSNACATDNKLFLNKYSFENSNVKSGNSVLFNYTTSGACNTSAVLYFMKDGDPNHEIAFSASIEDPRNPYFEVPENLATGKYLLVEILLFGLNSDGTTFTTYYSSINSDADYLVEITNKYLNVTNDNKEKVELKNISLEKSKANLGEKVNIKLSPSEGLISTKLIFKSASGNHFSVFINDLINNPYFTVPSVTSTDKYSLYQVVLASDKVTTTYTKGKDLNFDINLEITKNEKEQYVYNNSDINEKIINNIYNADEKVEVSINATDNSIISENLFNTIKGTQKKLVINYNDNYFIFCGNDIVTPKSIDAKITTSLAKENEKLNNIANSGIIVNFESNGNLPGKALVKIKITEEMKKMFGNDDIYIYYYDETNNGFNTIKSKVSPVDGYYEFTIDHNSKYLLVNNKLDNNLIIEKEDENVVGFQMSDKMYLIMIAGGIILILVVILIILKSKKTKKINSKKED